MERLYPAADAEEAIAVFTTRHEGRTNTAGYRSKEMNYLMNNLNSFSSVVLRTALAVLVLVAMTGWAVAQTAETNLSDKLDIIRL